MSDESHHEKELGGQLLASVSRSFYLTLKALPRELREPISLAYLLARTADTIADTATVPAELRLRCLEVYDSLVQGRAGQSESAELEHTVRVEFAPQQADDAERRLMEHFGEGLAWLGTMKGAALAAIRQVLQNIIQGQMLDIRRFPADGSIHGLNTAAELEEYTWLVAGSVGEFWTEMCALEKQEALDGTVPTAQMKQWGAAYGKGLQLINILRDVGEDMAEGRCYLPGGLESEAALKREWQRWLEVCRSHLEQGLLYVRHVADGKLRYATALPLLLGIKTVVRMQAASWKQVQSGIKISRLEVTSILARAALACRSGHALEKLYRQLSTSGPV